MIAVEKALINLLTADHRRVFYSAVVEKVSSVMLLVEDNERTAGVQSGF